MLNREICELREKFFGNSFGYFARFASSYLGARGKTAEINNKLKTPRRGGTIEK